ncbi:MAG: toxin PIN [Prevotella sp.]
MKKVYFTPQIKLKEIGWDESIMAGSDSLGKNEDQGHSDHLSKGGIFEENLEDPEIRQWGD